MRRLSVLLLIMAFVFPASAQDATSTPVALPSEIVYQSPIRGLLPEGIEWDAEGGTFLVGSIAAGTIHRVADDGTVTELAADERFGATIGIHIANDKLYVANSDPRTLRGGIGTAGLVIIDLATNSVESVIDLTPVHEPTGRHFANDVVVDGDGNAYVTDSNQPVVYKVTPEGEASVLVVTPLLSSGGFGGNGIEYHPDGYLLVANLGARRLIRIPLDDPDAAAEVTLDETLAIDGMALGADGILYAVADSAAGKEIVALASEDDWQQASVIARVDADPEATTLALRYDAEGSPPAVYYTSAYFAHIMRTEYTIVRAPLVVELAISE